ncbi:MAG: hypothetical protein V4671_01300 [Armatimonadota bacterium]
MVPGLYLVPAVMLGLTLWAASNLSPAVAGQNAAGQSARGPADGPPASKKPLPLRRGNATAGRDVFRFETFGNEGFWTDAVRMPQGMKAAKVTPLAALKAGVSVDADRIPGALRPALEKELKSDLSPQNAPLLNDPATMEKLIKANAVIGMVPKGGKVGVACALCHTITDASLYGPKDGNGAGVGRRIDGPTQHFLNVGKLLSIAANSRALYPVLQHQKGAKTIGRAPRGVTVHSTEAEVDAYLSNPKYYPIGTFDDTPDGNGNSVHIAPFFRQDLAAPFGSSGQNAVLEDFNNTVYTALFDQTTLTTPGGRAFLKALGNADGERISREYAQILKATGVKGYPYVRAAKAGKLGKAATPVGLRVNNQKLLDLNAYVASLPAPQGVDSDVAALSRGRELFRSNCTSCHNVDQSKPVPAVLIPMRRIYPGYRPMIIAKRKPPLSPIQNAPGTFDDKMIVVDASPGGGIRGNALPLLLDLARKPVFLHDDSVKGLPSLLDPARGATAPHPFYLRDAAQRADMVTFLRSLDTAKAAK